MIQGLFLNLLEVSITASVVILLIFAISPRLEKKYTAKWKYYVWMVIAIRLLIPVPLTIPDAPIEINTGQVFQGSEPGQFHLPSEIVLSDAEQMTQEKQGNYKESISILEISAMTWVTVAMVFAIYHILRYILLIKNLKRWSMATNAKEKIIFNKIKTDLGINRKISLRYCEVITSPMMFGVIKPTVLIPPTEYSETDLYLILKHELMHYKHHDIQVKVILFLVQTLYWFNPLIYLMSKKMNEAMEMSCDEYVISGNDAIYKKRYMETILQSIKQQTVGYSLFTSNYNGGVSVMKKRFQNIVYSGSKKKGLVALTLFLVLSLALTSLVACTTTGSTVEEEQPNQDVSTEENIENTPENEEVTTDEPERLTESIIGVYAESEPNARLEKTIIDALEIPDDYLAKTKYYYNYVDLNGDGVDEIFTVVMGPYTSGTGGSTGLHIIETPTEMNVNQVFSLMRTPIIISDEITNGCNELIVMRSGGGMESNYVVLTASDGQYTNVNDGTIIEGLDGISGKAIISNDLMKDMEEGNILYLEEQ